MSKGKAVALAAFTAWPVLYTVLSWLGPIEGMLLTSSSGSGDATRSHAILLIVSLLRLLTMLEVVVLLVIYICHVFKTDRVPQDKKALWAVVLFLGSVIAMPIYWYLHIWPRSGKGASHQTQAG